MAAGAGRSNSYRHAAITSPKIKIEPCDTKPSIDDYKFLLIFRALYVFHQTIESDCGDLSRF
jgi:hypothetical protein